MKRILFSFFMGLCSILLAQKQDPGHLAQNNLTGKVKLCVDSATYWLDSLFFDRNGYLMEEKSLRPYNGEFSTVTYTYRDTLVDKLIWKHGGKTEWREYHYDSLNRCTLETHNGKPYIKTKY